MDDVVTKDGIFKYRWYPGFKDILFGKEGCEACSLYNDEYCPKEKCTKDGVYFIMSFDEMKRERIQKHIEEKKLKKQQELDISDQSGLKK